MFSKTDKKTKSDLALIMQYLDENIVQETRTRNDFALWFKLMRYSDRSIDDAIKKGHQWYAYQEDIGEKDYLPPYYLYVLYYLRALDAAWCNEHGISPSCFYNAVTRLRKKACQIPDPVGKASTLDLTSHKQDVVQIAIEPESSPAGLIPDNGNSPMHLDNSHTIEIEADGLLIRMSNEIKPVLLKMLMDTLKESLC